MMQQRQTGSPAKRESWRRWLGLFLLSAAVSLVAACVMLSNRQLTQDLAAAQGVVRVGIILQRWPHFLAKEGQQTLGEDFITAQTIFYGPWQLARPVNPVAMDVAEVTDADLALVLAAALHKRGYEPLLLSDLPEAAAPRSVQELLARQEEAYPELDGFLFCYYAPTLFVASPELLPTGAGQRSVSLWELASKAGWRGNLIWSGKRLGQAPPHTMIHAFIYTSITLFRAKTHKEIWLTADSRVGGPIRPAIAECLPAPTEKDYRTDPAMIRRIMLNNLRCRLWHLLPEALPAAGQ
ncbi:MAG: hypothetical protein ACUVRZ_06770 [Desulfobacca sp.]|uniref:hypothetical protein n=1 Tax=Desulfobacca sp. TaxID=2067990 RepID=UPI00404A3BC1